MGDKFVKLIQMAHFSRLVMKKKPSALQEELARTEHSEEMEDTDDKKTDTDNADDKKTDADDKKTDADDKNADGVDKRSDSDVKKSVQKKYQRGPGVKRGEVVGYVFFFLYHRPPPQPNLEQYNQTYRVTQKNLPRKKLNKIKSYKDRKKLCSGEVADIYLQHFGI